MRFQDKVCVITGGAAGIGRATVVKFAAEGATVAFCDLNEADGQALAAELGEKASFTAVNVADRQAVEKWLEDVVARYGRIDILINNAGITRDAQLVKVKEGALVVVSHDRYFLDRNVDFLMSFEEGVLGTRYPAPYETYQQLREQEVAAAEPARKSAPSVNNKPAAKSNNRPRKLTWKEQRELEAAEAAIETLTKKVATLAAEINEIGSDYERLQPLVDELEQSKEALETAEFRWLELTEIAENS